MSATNIETLENIASGIKNSLDEDVKSELGFLTIGEHFALKLLLDKTKLELENLKLKQTDSDESKG
jgi:hypothetical protein